MKRLMIVGASILQLPAIVKAKDLGYYVAVVDYNPEAVGIKYADKYYNASTIDENQVLEAALDFNPDGIMTLATDMPMRSVALVAERMGLPGISYEVAVKATDKYRMILAFKENNVPSPWFYHVSSKEDLYVLSGCVSFPCIMKPTDNAGSKGVVKVSSYDELIEKYEYSHSCSRSGNVIVQEFMEGEEVSVEIMIVDGTPHVIQITDKLTTGEPYFVELGHNQPSRLPHDVQKQIIDVAVRACAAIGLDNGPAHVEMKVIPGCMPKMIELGARMGGDNITTALVPLSTGVDMVKATIQMALGIEPDLLSSQSRSSAIRYIGGATSGRLKSISGFDDAVAMDGVRQLAFTKSIGDEVSEIRCSNDRIGFVISQANSVEEAIQICEKAKGKIKIEIE